MSDILSIDHTTLTVTETDVSTAGSVWVVSPTDGKIVYFASVIDGAIATANAAITMEIGGTAVTGAALTITHASSAAGDVDSAVPTALNHVTKGQAIEIITDGASANTVSATYTVVIKHSTN